MANILSIISRNTSPGLKRTADTKPDIYIMRIDGDPSAGDGTEAPTGSIAIYDAPGGTTVYYKYDNLDTSWRSYLDADGLVGAMPAGSAKGDIAVYNGDEWVVQSAGADGYVLTADTAEADGIKWAEAAGGAFGTVANVTSNSAGDLATDNFVFGSVQLNDDGDATHDSRIIFDKAKGTFAAGTVEGTQWDSRDSYSAIFGFNNTASGRAVIVGGYGQTVSGWYSGAVGWGNNISQSYSFAAGQNNVLTTASHATAFGNGNTASGQYSVAMGEGSTASGTHAVAMGYQCQATQPRSVAMGDRCTANAQESFAFGQQNTTTGIHSTAFGANNSASGGAALVGGYQSTANGTHSIAWGNKAYANKADSAVFNAYASSEDEGALVVGLGDQLTTSPGDKQFTILNLEETTTDATADVPLQNTSTIDGVFIDTNATYIVDIQVVAHSKTTAGDFAGFSGIAWMRHDGSSYTVGTGTTPGTVTLTESFSGGSATSSWAAKFALNTSRAEVQVTGEASNTIEWTATLRITKAS